MDFKKLAVLGSAMAFGLYLSACGDDSSSGPAGDDGKKTEGNGGSGDIRLPDVSGEGCDFKVDDKVWSYVLSVGAEGLDTKTYRYYTYDKNGSTDSTVAVTKGASATAACAYVNSNKIEDESEDSRHVEYTKCKDGVMYVTSVDENFYQTQTRDQAFEDIMNHCKTVNNYDKDEIRDSVKSALNSSDSKGGEKSSSSEKKPTSSSESEVKSSSSISAAIDCDFTKDDDVWSVSMGGVSDMVIEWTDNGAVMVTKTDMQMADLCDLMVTSMNEDGVEASCEGAVLVMRDSNELVGATKDELYEDFSAMCSE